MRLHAANRRRRRQSRTLPPGIRPTGKPPRYMLTIENGTLSDDDAARIRRLFDALRGSEAWRTPILDAPASIHVEEMAPRRPRGRRTPAWLREVMRGVKERREKARLERTEDVPPERVRPTAPGRYLFDGLEGVDRFDVGPLGPVVLEIVVGAGGALEVK